jgi:hypothetical protein
VSAFFNPRRTCFPIAKGREVLKVHPKCLPTAYRAGFAFECSEYSESMFTNDINVPNDDTRRFQEHLIAFLEKTPKNAPCGLL